MVAWKWERQRREKREELSSPILEKLATFPSMQ
jgi:hypothetical protein